MSGPKYRLKYPEYCLQYSNNCLKSPKYCFKDPASGRCKALEGRPSLIFAHKTDMRKLDLDRWCDKSV